MTDLRGKVRNIPYGKAADFQTALGRAVDVANGHGTLDPTHAALLHELKHLLDCKKLRIEQDEDERKYFRR